jgi:hypothetical protein
MKGSDKRTNTKKYIRKVKTISFPFSGCVFLKNNLIGAVNIEVNVLGIGNMNGALSLYFR